MSGAAPQWKLTPAETAAALAEGKARGLPDGWNVTLDVSLHVGEGKILPCINVSHSL